MFRETSSRPIFSLNKDFCDTNLFTYTNTFFDLSPSFILFCAYGDTFVCFLIVIFFHVKALLFLGVLMTSSSSSSFSFSSSRDNPLMNKKVDPIGVNSLSSHSDSFSVQGDALEIESSSMTMIENHSYHSCPSLYWHFAWVSQDPRVKR